MKKTLIALVVAASAAVSGSAMAWTQGDFNGSVDIGGSISQEQSTWQWKVGNESADSINLKLADAVHSGSDNVWNNVGEKSYPILLGKTVSEYTGISSGMAPVITYSGDGFKIKYPADSAPEVELNATGKTDTSKVGTLTFKMNIFGLLNATRSSGEVYQLLADTSKAYGNGYLQNAGYVNTLSADLVRDNVERILEGEMIDISSDAAPASGYAGPNHFNNTGLSKIQGVYASEYVANSGTLTFPQNATPDDWKASLEVTVSYQ